MKESTKAQFPAEQSEEGKFVRQEDAFRSWVTADDKSEFPAAASRYHLYVSLACPWASRTVIVRKLKGLEEAIGVTVVDPIRDERGWRFTRDEPDPLNAWAFLSEAYFATESSYRGRVTVPVLWDKERKRIVSNNDDHIMRMLETEFDAFATNPLLDLYPRGLRAEIDELNEFLYETFNNGVYRAGFATSQAVYERAAKGLFSSSADEPNGHTEIRSTDPANADVTVLDMTVLASLVLQNTPTGRVVEPDGHPRRPSVGLRIGPVRVDVVPHDVDQLELAEFQAGDPLPGGRGSRLQPETGTARRAGDLLAGRDLHHLDGVVTVRTEDVHGGDLDSTGSDGWIIAPGGELFNGRSVPGRARRWSGRVPPVD